jgi:D-alanine-D-alanine ligase
MRIVILHDAIKSEAAPDELDTIIQARVVEDQLLSLGHSACTLPFSTDFHSTLETIKKKDPELVFNLVESLESRGDLIHVAPVMLDLLQIPYTGCSSKAIFETSNKILAKTILENTKIATPTWFKAESNSSQLEQVSLADNNARFIVKSIWEHASIGISDSSVVSGYNQAKNVLLAKIPQDRFFAESFVEGREFNVGVLQTDKGPTVLPIAEIVFRNFPAGKPRIVGYDAKWNEGSFEYNNTVREFCTSNQDQSLRDNLGEIALQCWNAFRLSGYARVDFRLDTMGNIYVLEVNTNPCISPDAGFMAAANNAQLSQRDVIECIVKAARGSI